MVMKLALLSLVLAACLVTAAPARYRDVIGAADVAYISEEHLTKREGVEDLVGAVEDTIAELKKRGVYKVASTVDVNVAKRDPGDLLGEDLGTIVVDIGAGLDDIVFDP